MEQPVDLVRSGILSWSDRWSLCIPVGTVLLYGISPRVCGGQRSSPVLITQTFVLVHIVFRADNGTIRNAQGWMYWFTVSTPPWIETEYHKHCCHFVAGCISINPQCLYWILPVENYPAADYKYRVLNPLFYGQFKVQWLLLLSHIISQCQRLMKFEYTHQWIMNVIVDSYRIFSVDNDGNTYFSFLPLIACLSWSSRERFCAQIIVGIRQRSRMNERILIFSLIGLYLGLKSHKDINTNFISKYLLEIVILHKNYLFLSVNKIISLLYVKMSFRVV